MQLLGSVNKIYWSSISWKLNGQITSDAFKSGSLLPRIETRNMIVLLYENEQGNVVFFGMRTANNPPFIRNSITYLPLFGCAVSLGYGYLWQLQIVSMPAFHAQSLHRKGS